MSFQGQGKLGGTATTEIGTYWQEIRPGGTFYGEGGPLIMTEDGELVSWKGFGVGKPTGPGFAASFGVCGAMQTSSERHAHLNGVASVGEYEVDSEGNYSWRLWEWKVAGA